MRFLNVFTGVFNVTNCDKPVVNYVRQKVAVVLICCYGIRLFVANYVCVVLYGVTPTSILVFVFRVMFS